MEPPSWELRAWRARWIRLKWWSRSHPVIAAIRTATALGVIALLAWWGGFWDWAASLKDDPTALVGTLLTLVIALAATIITWRTHAWNQHTAAIEISEKWQALLPQRDLVKEFVDREGRPRKDIADLDPRSHGVDQVHVAARDILNHLQVTCAGVQTKMFEPEMMYRLYGHIVVDYNDSFRRFIARHRQAENENNPNGPMTWDYIDEVARTWKKRMLEEETVRPPGAPRSVRVEEDSAALGQTPEM